MNCKIAAVLSLSFLISLPLLAQDHHIDRLEFRDRPVADILLALGEAGHMSIVPDGTISGNASYYFSDMNFDEALNKFSSAFNLHTTLKDGVYYVSRIDAHWDRSTGLADLDVDNVELSLVVRAFAKTLGITILHDELPARSITIHAAKMAPAAILDILVKSFPELSLEVADTYFYLHRVDMTKKPGSPANSKQALKKNGSLYSLDADKASFQDLITEIFAAEGKDYSMLIRSDSIIDGLKFHDRSFEDALRLILEQANADYVLAGNTYYVFEIQRKDVIKKLKVTVSIPVENIAVSDITSLLPPDFASSGMLRFDKASNTVYLSGSIEEIGPVQDFIKQIDVPPAGHSYVRFDLKNLKAKDVVSILPSRFSSLSPVQLPDGSGFVALVSPGQAQDLTSYLSLIDRKSTSAPIRLRYIKTEDLLKNLPPSVTKDNIVDGGNGSVIFFVGSEDKRRAFTEELALIDRPKPQIRYDILVVQYTLGDEFDLNQTLKVSPLDSSSATNTTVVADLEKLLSLNLNIVSELGYLFAVNLSTSLTQDRAQIFADTTINGTVGKEMKFQNTSTYRYLELEVDSDTGKVKSSGVTKEVTSGLILVLNGWVSGDGMITMDISATVSERSGTDSSSTTTTTTPPTTSERVVTTNVRTPSGKPIVIGGLRQQKTETSTSKVPFFGDIPLLGKLFQQRADKTSDTEIVIYLVPHLTEDEEGDGATAFRLERVYTDLVRDF